ncbi:hypothetical protein BVC80_8855g7 [Macleaya cordata]|uniref:Uncharacterized protein n=1 Tax=Macleaya cordata TaxID=56857 RepID=A0A200PY38_MACCD|nr:hypothetical protein BVC80_8855g7 [Macleaya cordata]
MPSLQLPPIRWNSVEKELDFRSRAEIADVAAANAVQLMLLPAGWDETMKKWVILRVLNVLRATSATTHVVLGQFKTCMILLGGFLIFGSNPGTTDYHGMRVY